MSFCGDVDPERGCLMDANFPRYEAEAAMLEAALADPLYQAIIDDVRDRVACPDGANPKNFGEVIQQMKANGLIRKVGHAYTKRKVAHGRDVCLWQLVNVEVARKRLEQLRQQIEVKTKRAVAARSVQGALF
jgi:hypothetical protein